MEHLPILVWVAIVAAIGSNLVTTVAYAILAAVVAPKINLGMNSSNGARVAKYAAMTMFSLTALWTMNRSWEMISYVRRGVDPAVVDWPLRFAILLMVVHAAAAVMFLNYARRHLNVKIFDRELYDRVIEDYLIENERAGSSYRNVDLRNEEHALWVELLDEAIKGDTMKIVYQPIVNINTRMVVGYEALARFEDSPYTTEQWFVAAARFGMDERLEMAAMCRALEGFRPRRLDGKNVYLSLNVSQDTILSRNLQEVIRGNDPHLCVLELTEHIATVRYKPLLDACRSLRRIGVKIAIDDVGSGFASMRRVIELQPEIIKIDRSLTALVDSDEHQQALIRAMVTYSQDVNVNVVVEGVETEQQERTLKRLGVRFAQGWLYGRPEPLSSALK